MLDSPDIIKFGSLQEAEISSRNWCVIKADNLESAKENFNEGWKLWANKINEYPAWVLRWTNCVCSECGMLEPVNSKYFCSRCYNMSNLIDAKESL